MIKFIAVMLSIPVASSFVAPQSHPASLSGLVRRGHAISRARMLAMASPPNTGMQHSWSPQDLTKDCPGFLPIPDDDYVKKYQRNPELWPVEFFLIAYRRIRNTTSQKSETQVLVRKSANGTSKWGVGTGVPATRWVLSTQERPPLGYKWSEAPVSPQEPVQEPARIRFEASNFPEFPKNGQKSWSYDKIDIREDAFNGPDAASLKDAELEEYADKIRQGLRRKLAEQMSACESMDAWEATRVSVVKNIVDRASSLAAIQGTLRMSGLFARRWPVAGGAEQAEAGGRAGDCGAPGPRFVSLGQDAPDHDKLIESMRIYTMFPQMPDPMPQPSATPAELQAEIESRDARMAASLRDPHRCSKP